MSRTYEVIMVTVYHPDVLSDPTETLDDTDAESNEYANEAEIEERRVGIVQARSAHEACDLVAMDRGYNNARQWIDHWEEIDHSSITFEATEVDNDWLAGNVNPDGLD